jgi:hypothetical protein
MAKKTNMNFQIVRKISSKTVCGEIAAAKEPTDLFTVFGIVHGVKKIESQFSDEPDNCYIGDFEAVNLKSGEIFKGSKLYLPEPANTMLDTKVQAAQGQKTKFKYTIGVTAPTDKRNKAGYEFIANDLMAAVSDQEMDELRNL